MQKQRIRTKPWGRQHYTGRGVPKVQFLTEYSAQKVVKRLNPQLEYDIYICQICFYYHIGRRAKPEKRFWAMLLEARATKQDEVLAGKLVFALRNVLDKEDSKVVK